MAWELKNVEEQRLALVEAYVTGQASMTELCEHYGISRKTAYKWYDRYLAQGKEGLVDQPKAPHQPRYRYEETIINMALEMKLKHRMWGAKKILCRLCQLYPKIDWPSRARLYQIFYEHNLVLPRRLRRRVSGTHPLGEVNNSNDVWMADFKGWFLTNNKQKCEPLTVTDGFSRYLITCRHLESKTAEDVWPVIEAAFVEYGLPKRIRTDNGPPFGSVGAGRLTRLSINLIKAGVVPEWINPGHPEENGRHERFHRTLKEAIAKPPADTLEEQLYRMATFHMEYNYERPHEALEMQTPASYYRPSKQKWDGILREPEYDTAEMQVRKVGQNGCIWIKHIAHYIGETLTGENVGLKEEEGALKIYYGPVYLGTLKVGEKLQMPKLKPKRIIRRA